MNLALFAADMVGVVDLSNPADITTITSFTFFVGCMAMMAASVFFFFEMWNVDKKWRTSLLVSGLITFIAFVHYYYMRSYHFATGDSPTFFRYVDWTLTVPLMCVEFYLITKKAGGTMGLMWKLIVASVIMLVTGYLGETIYNTPSGSWVWGLISGIAYFYIAYLVWMGEVRQLADNAGGAVAQANKVLAWFVLVGWAIYPLGYILGTEGGLFGMKMVADAEAAQASMDVVYNIGDAINKIGFGLVIYALAVKDGAKGYFLRILLKKCGPLPSRGWAFPLPHVWQQHISTRRARSPLDPRAPWGGHPGWTRPRALGPRRATALGRPAHCRRRHPTRRARPHPPRPHARRSGRSFAPILCPPLHRRHRRGLGRL